MTGSFAPYRLVEGSEPSSASAKLSAIATTRLWLKRTDATIYYDTSRRDKWAVEQAEVDEKGFTSNA